MAYSWETANKIHKYADDFGVEEAMNKFNISSESVHRAIRISRSGLVNDEINEDDINDFEDEIIIEKEATDKVLIDNKDNNRTVQSTSLVIDSLEKLLEVTDTDLNYWNIDRHVINSWAVTMKIDNEPVYRTNYQIKAWLSPKRPEKQLLPHVKPVNINISKIKTKVKKVTSDNTLVFGDAHFGFRKDIYSGKLTPFHDRAALNVVLQIAADTQPKRIGILGDMSDLAEWSDKFMKEPEFYWTTQAMFIEQAWYYGQLRTLCPDTEIFMLTGNHECFDTETEILTKEGWKKWDGFDETSLLATYNTKEDKIEYQKPTKKHIYDHSGKMCRIDSRYSDLLITPNHRLYYNCGGDSAWRFDEIQNISKGRNRVKVKSSSSEKLKDVNKSDEVIKLLGWFLTDSSLRSKYNYLSFYQRKSNVNRILDILNSLDLEYRYKERNRDIKEICGKKLKSIETQCEIYLSKENTDKVLSWLDVDSKTIPVWAKNLSDYQFDLLLEELIDADGSIHPSSKDSFMFYSSNYNFISEIQELCFLHNYRAFITEYREGQYRLNITKAKESVMCTFGENYSEEDYNGKVWCATTKNDTLIVRRNGKISITGNSRLNRMLISHLISAYNLKPVDQLEKPPMMSPEYLMNLESLNIEYISGYPKGRKYFDGIKASHGQLVRKGSSVHEVLKDAQESNIFGHIHRMELAFKTITTEKGQETIFTFSPGTLARIDGYVPSNGGDVNWQQGAGMIHHENGNYPVPIVINNGRAIYNGKLYEAEDYLDELNADTTNSLDWGF